MYMMSPVRKLCIWNICINPNRKHFFDKNLSKTVLHLQWLCSYDEACSSVSVISKQCFQNLETNKDWDNISNHVFVINSQYPNNLHLEGIFLKLLTRLVGNLPQILCYFQGEVLHERKRWFKIAAFEASKHELDTCYHRCAVP